MNLSGPQIKNRSIVGTLDRKPVHMIETLGGLHLIVMAEEGLVKTLGAGPHRAIAMFTAERKRPDIKWNEDLTKNLESNTCPLCKQDDTYRTCLCLYREGYR